MNSSVVQIVGAEQSRQKVKMRSRAKSLWISVQIERLQERDVN